MTPDREAQLAAERKVRVERRSVRFERWRAKWLAQAERQRERQERRDLVERARDRERRQRDQRLCRKVLAFRVSAALYNRIERAAARHGCSMSEEARRRLGDMRL